MVHRSRTSGTGMLGQGYQVRSDQADCTMEVKTSWIGRLSCALGGDGTNRREVGLKLEDIQRLG